MAIYDPNFIDEAIAPLFGRFGVAQDDRLVVRFLTMLNAGFLPGMKYVIDKIGWDDSLEKSGKVVRALENGYCKKAGDAGIEKLKSYFDGLKNGKIKCFRFNLADKDYGRVVRKHLSMSFFSEPDAVETGRYHFVPLKGEEPEGVGFSGVLEPSVIGFTKSNFSRNTYAEWKNPDELAKEAGIISGLRPELFLIDRD